MERKFPGSSVEADSHLISAHLTAFKDFGNEVSKGVGEIKIIDMGALYLILVVQGEIFIAGVASKRDDKNILFNKLTKLLDIFIKRFQKEIKEWRGDLSTFRGFEDEIENVLQGGKVGEIKLRLPILKTYKKSYHKIVSKELVIKKDDLEKALRQKRLPRQPISQGFLSERAYEIAHLADGLHTLEEISEDSGLSIEEVIILMKDLDDLGLLSYIEVK